MRRDHVASTLIRRHFYVMKVHHESPWFDLDGKIGVNRKNPASQRFARVPSVFLQVFARFLFESTNYRQCMAVALLTPRVDNGSITDAHDASTVRHDITRIDTVLLVHKAVLLTASTTVYCFWWSCDI